MPLTLEELDIDRHAEIDAAIVAYPHGAAAPLVAQLRERGVRVVDLSADFRLRDPGVYAEWYHEHDAPELIEQAVYGLPELYREQVREAALVANPGCYPTATLLALAPLARAGIIGDVIVDAKSGVSGAGRAATAKTHFVTVDENLNAYGVPRHRHTPEIEQELGAMGADVRITFTPHLVPLDQGELVSLLCDAAPTGAPTSTSIGCTRTPTATSSSSSSQRLRPESATSARRTSAASRCTATSAPGGSSCSARSTTSGRARRRRRCRTST